MLVSARALLRARAPATLRPAARVRVAGVRVQAAAAAAKKGDFVTVHYTGSLDDGSTFDSSRGRDPLEFIVGAGGVIAGFDRAVSGLEVGGTRTVRLDPAEAYGERSDEARIQVPASQAPKGLVTGTRVGLSNGASAVVVAIDESSVTLDLNHELAGQSLTFEVEIVSICPSERMRTAVFAQGCFWGPQLRFQRLPGVIATEVAYCNGSNAFPKVTYEQVCNGDTGYAEALQVVYDSAAVSYEELLDVFFATHDPTQKDRQGNDVGTQYRSGIFLVTPDQREAALKAKAAWQAKLGGATIETEIAPLALYTPAEDMHQSYLAKGGRFGKPQSAAKSCSDPIRCYG